MRFVAVAALLVAAGAAQADVVAYWGFPATAPANNWQLTYPFVADAKANAGAATIDTDARKWDGTPSGATALQQGAMQLFAGSTINLTAPVAAAGQALAMRSLNGDSNGKSIFVTFDNSNYQDLSLTLAERVTTTGPTDVAVSISTDGVNYTSVTSYVLTDRSSTFYLRTIDLSSADFTDGGSSVTIKLTYTGFSATSGTGAIRLDNVRLDGTLVPTPGVAALMGLGGLLAARRRR